MQRASNANSSKLPFYHKKCRSYHIIGACKQKFFRFNKVKKKHLPKNNENKTIRIKHIFRWLNIYRFQQKSSNVAVICIELIDVFSKNNKCPDYELIFRENQKKIEEKWKYKKLYLFSCRWYYNNNKIFFLIVYLQYYK